MKRHLVLIGLPGAGKTTAGRLAADRLDTHCTDIDPIIVRATGLSIVELFAEEGEAAFREREHRAVVDALDLPAHVVTPGGGWATRPGRLPAIRDRALAIHLAVDPAVAALRLAGDDTRPLLAGDPAARLLELSREREPWYRTAPVAIDTSDRTPEEVADLVVAAARAEAGW